MNTFQEKAVIIRLIGISKWLISFVFILVVLGAYLFMSKAQGTKTVVVEKVVEVAAKQNTKEPKGDFFEGNFDVATLGDSPLEKTIKQGHQIIVNTHREIGPLNDNPQRRFTGNLLTCNNCHLDAGTKAFAAPFIGVTGRFPQYRGRENQVGSIEERVNGCMERSMNGKRLPDNSPEMRSIVAYMNWLSKGVPVGEKVNGQGFKAIDVPERKVDLKNGGMVYKNACASCHGENAEGSVNNDGTYAFPPLAGPKSYNNGAGMHRVLSAAQFIKHNMPLGATAENSILSDEEAFDVAGYINSLDRPKKKHTEIDYPDLKKKPMSTPYAPWEDAFSAEQHKYGPYQEIADYYKSKYNLIKNK